MSFYLLVRAYYVDITDDEAWSYYNVKRFWWVEVLCSGNTHWFNFLAIKTALMLGLEKTWHLRWFSLLSGVVFLYIGYRWIITFSNLAVKVFAFSLLFLNPYLVEYLTLARGYSAALCFVALSFYFYCRTERRIIISVPLLFAGLSAIANFNFFYFFVPFALMYFVSCYLKDKSWLFKSKAFYFDMLFVLGVSFLVLRALWFIKLCSNDIGSFGGDNLIRSVFGSYLDTLFYGQFYFPSSVKDLLGVVLLILVLGGSVYGILKFQSHQIKLFTMSSCVLLGMLILVVFNHVCFNILYPTERTALMFYPVAVIVTVFFLNDVNWAHSVKQSLFGLISTSLIINFFKTASAVSGYDHSYCMKTNQYFEFLAETPARRVGLAVEVYFVYLKYYKHTTCNFYAESINEYRINPRYLFDHQLEDFDYLLLLPPYNLKYYKTSPISFVPVKYFQDTGALIVKVTKVPVSS
jgi:hypothetical protein